MAKATVDLEALGRATQAFRENPTSRPRYDASVVWEGGYRTSSQLGSFAGPDGDEPVEYAGTGTGPAPEDLLLAAAAQCLLVGIVGAAAVRRIEMRSLLVHATGAVNLPAAFGVAEGHPGFESVELHVALDADAPRADLEALVQGALAKAPVPSTLARPTPVKARLA